MGNKHLIYKDEAERLVRSVISNDPGLIGWSVHCKVEMVKDNLIVNDLINVLKSGKIKRKAELDLQSDEYVYRIETARIVVVFKFKNFVRGQKTDLGIKLITCWRK